MEDAVRSQRAIIFFLWKEDTPVSDIVLRLSNVFQGIALQKSAVYNGVHQFENGREFLDDEDRSGRLATTSMVENVEKVSETINANRCLTKFDSDENDELNCIPSINAFLWCRLPFFHLLSERPS